MDELEHDEVLTAFNHAAEELRFFKAQQWHVANYVLLADAALLTAPQLIDDPGYAAFARLVAAGLAIGAAVFGWLVLASLDLALDKERDRMKLAHDKLHALWAIHEPTHASSRFDAASLLRTAIIVGAGITVAISFAALG